MATGRESGTFAGVFFGGGGASDIGTLEVRSTGSAEHKDWLLLTLTYPQ